MRVAEPERVFYPTPRAISRKPSDFHSLSDIHRKHLKKLLHPT